MTPEDIASEFRTPAKSYERKTPIEGVRVLPLSRFTDDRGSFIEVFRSQANHPGGRALAEFFSGVPIAQLWTGPLTAAARVRDPPAAPSQRFYHPVRWIGLVQGDRCPRSRRRWDVHRLSGQSARWLDSAALR